MAAPTESFAATVYAGLRPLAQQDSANGWALANFITALGKMFQLVDDYGRDELVNGVWADGWSQLLDINRVPDAALPWLAQFVGATLNPSLSIADQKLQIQNVNSWQRGSVASIVAAAQSFLTDTKTVIVRERDAAASASNPAYGLTIITKTAETPDSAKVLAALLAQKPAGIVLNYQVLAGQDYLTLYNAGATTYQTVFTTYTTYQGVLNAVPGT